LGVEPTFFVLLWRNYRFRSCRW